jgi:D-alanyl-lipoteichoic acid acyltransferase DltB (MBOAT superfamily)
VLQFNSPGFVFFLGIVVALYYLIPSRTRWIWILAVSYYFYHSIVPFGSILYLVATTLVAYICGLGISRNPPKKSTYLTLGIVANLGLLFFVKYLDFLFEQLGFVFGFTAPQLGIKLPAGLSFYVFMTVTYMVDVYRGQMEAERHLGNFAQYVAYFPKILAGPIERARTFLPQVRERIRFDPEKVVEGSQLILFGLIKKLVIADRLAPVIENAYKSPQWSSPFELVLATYFFAFQIYCDFSGYTDIARGAAKLMGIDLMENFRRPFLSKTCTEFWSKRWHISLGTWFRDYMYIPMGGSRVSRPRWYFNLMMVFVVSGFWHAGLGYGVNWSFMLWGAVNGIYQWVSVATTSTWKSLGDRSPKVRDSAVMTVIRVIFTFNLIVFSLIFFRANSVGDSLTIISRVYQNINMFPMLIKTYNFSSEIILSFLLIALLYIVDIFDERKSIWERLRTKPVVFRWAVYYILILGLIILGKWGQSQFIYMGF